MATWTQPPRDQDVRVREYIEAKHPGLALSFAIDGERRITHVEMPDLTDDELAALMVDVQAAFPGAFG